MTLRDSEAAPSFSRPWKRRGKNWRAKGAALKLGLNRTTLIYRMKKLGIYQPLRRVASSDDFMTPGRPPSAATV